MAHSLTRTLNQVWKYVSAFRAGETSRFHPDSILVEPTSTCNLHCIHCYRESRIHTDLKKVDQNMVLETFQAVIDQLSPHLTRLCFTGYGEPLIHPRLPEMTRYAAERGVSVRMVSNGILWSRERAEQMLSAGIAQVSFSLDAGTEETYRKVRQGDWHRATRGIRTFHEARRQADSKAGLAIFNVLNALNYHETAGMVKMGYELGADFISFAPVRTEGILPTDALTLERVDRGSLLEALRQALQADVEGRTSLRDLIATFECSETPHCSGADFCYSPWTDVMILSDGSVQPCCNYFGLARRYVFGNLNQQRFDSIWNGEAFRRFRREFVQDRICDWCRMYPQVDTNKVHERIQKFKRVLPLFRWFSKRKSLS